ncbi:MAG: Rne/Rng family ribonuclease [Actinobacteria bacterium]|nr:Rne/Rng family ribonuclease [Actinomycetota bacterium]
MKREPSAARDATSSEAPATREQPSPGSAGDEPSSEGGASAETPGGPPRAKRRRGRRGGKRHRRKPAMGDTASDEATAGEDGETKPAAPRAPSTRRTTPASGTRTPRPRTPGQGGQQRRPAKPPADQTGSQEPAAGAAEPEAPALSAESARAEDRAEALASMEGVVESDGEAKPAANGAKRRRRRGGRGRGGAKKATSVAGAEPDGTETEPPAAKPAPRPRQPARPRQPKAPPAAGSDAEEKAEAKDDQKKTEAPRGQSTRLAARAQRRGQRPPQRRRRLSEEEAKALRGEAKTLLIHAAHERTQIAVLENRQLIQHYVTRETSQTMVGNIYLGRVQNVIAGMEAAFVDLGRGRNAVLYAGEVNYAQEDLEGDAQPRIEKVLKSGQPVLVQVTKDPIGTKGARLTAQISLAGRYLVLAPEQRLTGISRRLHEDERARLRQALRDIRPDGHGVIVRTAAEGATKEALQRDLAHLVKQWDEIKKKQKRAKAPAVLNEEPELVMRVVRDIFSGDFEQVVVDDREIYDRIKSYLDDVAPELLDKLQLYAGSLPVFEAYHVTEQIHKALERKVWLPSGGSIVIDKTEAMTVIDVNTGRFVGKGGSLEDTVYKNNLEAAEEVARQLRLRDIGGIILIDFIDMLSMTNQKDVLRTLKRALARDKVRSQVSDEISKLGLVEMTRKRASEGLLEAFSETCPQCEGRGIVITHQID